MRWRWSAAGVAAGVLGALIIPVFGIKIGQARHRLAGQRRPRVRGAADAQGRRRPAGIVSPLEVLVDGDDPAGAADEVAEPARDVDGVATAFAPDDAAVAQGRQRARRRHPHRGDGRLDRGAASSSGVDDAISTSPASSASRASAPTVLDYVNAVYDNFPLTLGLIALVTFVLLVRTFRSILLPIKAVLLNILSVAATFGATVLFWQEGYGSEAIFGIAADRRGDVLAAGADLRVPLRAVDGLRGLHPGPHARGVRQDRRHRRGGGRRASAAPAGW